jgi:hypothetical protein
MQRSAADPWSSDRRDESRLCGVPRPGRGNLRGDAAPAAFCLKIADDFATKSADNAPDYPGVSGTDPKVIARTS